MKKFNFVDDGKTIASTLLYLDCEGKRTLFANAMGIPECTKQLQRPCVEASASMNVFLLDGS